MTDNQDSKIGDAVQPPTDRPLTAGDWHRDDNALGTLLYTTKQKGWRQGKPVMVNDVTVRIDRLEGDREPIVAQVLSALQARPATSAASEGEGVRRFRHKTRGTEYTLIGNGKAQCSPSGLLDNENVVLYRGDDGSLWARRWAEFFDGRFEELPALASPPVSERERELEGALRAFIKWGEAQCPCENELPNPCPLCDASVENLENCKAADKKFPPRLLANARRALTAQPAGEGK